MIPYSWARIHVPSRSSRVLRSDVLIDLTIYRGTICKSSDLAPSFFQLQVWDFVLNLCLTCSTSARAQWKGMVQDTENPSFNGSAGPGFLQRSSPKLTFLAFQRCPSSYGSPPNCSLSFLACFTPVCYIKEPIQMPINRLYIPEKWWVMMYIWTVYLQRYVASDCFQKECGRSTDSAYSQIPCRSHTGKTFHKRAAMTRNLFFLFLKKKKELHLWDPIDSHSPLTICFTQYWPCSWDFLREGWGRYFYTVLFFPPLIKERKQRKKIIIVIIIKKGGGGGEPVAPSFLLLGFLLYLPGCQMLQHSLHVSVLLQKLEEKREKGKLHCTVPVDKVQSRQRCLRTTCSLSLLQGKKEELNSMADFAFSCCCYLSLHTGWR